MRQLIPIFAFLLSVVGLAQDVDPKDTAKAIEQAHAKLWNRFVDKHGIILDFFGEIPTPDVEAA